MSLRDKQSDESALAGPGLAGVRYALDEDVQLMLRFQAGDAAAFDELVERNLAGVHGLAYKFLGDATLVEDVAQEAFLRVFRNAKTYQPRAKFTTWLYRIVANLCFNVSRSHKRRKAVSLEALGHDDASLDWPDHRGEPPAERLDRAELAQHVARAIGELPDQPRMAIVLHQYEHNSYAEIAQTMGTTAPAVKSLLSRGRAKLRDRLAKYMSE